MENRNYLTVSELNYYIHNVISSEYLLNSMLLLGEVSGTSERQGTFFFTIKDNSAQLPAIFFSSFGKEIPVNGKKYIFKGTPDYYQKTGKVTFKVTSLAPFGEGEMHLLLEKRRENLQKEGLFDSIYKKAIPLYPQKIGVITSVKGAVIQDIISTVRRNNFIQSITILDTKVQGEGAEDSIVSSILIADNENFDVIIIARGGGSFEELMPFNSENVVRAIFNMKTPVISAVGHETDTTLCDLVSDVRAATPTAAAEAVAFNSEVRLMDIRQNLSRMASTIDTRLGRIKTRVIISSGRIRTVSEKRLYGLSNILMKYLRNISEKSKDIIRSNEEKTYNLLSKIEAYSPVLTLKRGFIAAEKEGRPLTMVKSIKEKDIIKLTATDGSVKILVDKVIKD